MSSSTLAAASTPNLLLNRPLPSPPRRYPHTRLRNILSVNNDHYDDDDDESQYVLSTKSTPLTTSNPIKPPPKSPLRKSPPTLTTSSKQSSKAKHSPSSSTSTLLSWARTAARPVSNLRPSSTSTPASSNVNLPSLVSGLSSAASNLVSLRKTSPATPTKSVSRSETPISQPKTQRKTTTSTKQRTQSPPIRTRNQSPSPSLVLLTQDPHLRSRSPRSPSPATPTTPRTPSLVRTSTPRSPTRMRSSPSSAATASTKTTTGRRDSASPTPIRGRGPVSDLPRDTATTTPFPPQAHHQPNSTDPNHHHQPAHQPSSSHHPPPQPATLSHTKSVQSIQSTLSDGTTVISAKSSLFDRASGYYYGMHKRSSGGLNNNNNAGGGNYGTIRTVTTELTDPVLWDDDDVDLGAVEDNFEVVEEEEEVNLRRNDGISGVDGDCWVEEMQVKLKVRETFKFPATAAAVVPTTNGNKKQDLSRVNEVEEDESTSGCERRGRGNERPKDERESHQKSPVNLYLGKGKFPDDFIDALGKVGEVRREEAAQQKKPSAIPTRVPAPAPAPAPTSAAAPLPIRARTRTLTPITRSPPRSPAAAAPIPSSSSSPSSKATIPPPSPSPPRKKAIVGADLGRAASPSPTPTTTGGFPRRPTHWSRRSVDVPRSSSSNSVRGDSPIGGSGGSPVGRAGVLIPKQKSNAGTGAGAGAVDSRVPRRHSTSATRRPLASTSNTGVVVSPSPTGSAKDAGSGSGGSMGSSGSSGASGSGLSTTTTGVVGTGTKFGGVNARGCVPFPRTVSAEYCSHSPTTTTNAVGVRGLSPLRMGMIGRTPSPRGSDPSSSSSQPLGMSPGVGGGLMAERTRMRERERFQSNVEAGTSAIGHGGVRRRRRPSSYDEVGLSAVMGMQQQQQQQQGGGGRTRLRSRFESMVNLSGSGSGPFGPSASASASDLLLAARESVLNGEGGLSLLSGSAAGAGGSGSRKRLVVREEGKPPTQYQLGNCIGRGQFGSVYRALNENTGQMVAVKRIRLDGLKEEEVTQLMKEVDLVKSLSHPSVVKYEGMVREEGMLNIVLEYAENGSLGQTLKSFGKLNEALVARYVVKILEGLHYLHTANIVHCDLKAANILTTKNGNVKLTDFGVSLNLRAMERERGSVSVAGGGEPSGSGSGSGTAAAQKSGERHGNVAGTPNWMAPEVIELKGASTKADIWSLGCTVIELLTGRPPYADVGNAMSVMFRIVEDPMPPLPENCDAQLEHFLKQCFNKNPALRPSAEQLCEHPWLKTNWSAFKDLKAQDSIPWIRRISADFQKNDGMRYLNSHLEIPDTPLSASPKEHLGLMGRRTSASSVGKPSDGEFSPREHSFVKTTFSKPMICRVCLSDVKKAALICGQCSLISHAKCAPNAPPTCDLRAQLLLFAQYAEKGNPASVYSNPAAAAVAKNTNVALSDVAFVEHSRTSLDGVVAAHPAQSPSSPTMVEHGQSSSPPPTAFPRFIAAAFKRSKSSLAPEPAVALNDEEQQDGSGGGNAKPPAVHRLIRRSLGALHPSSPSAVPSLPPPVPPRRERAVSSSDVASCGSSLRSAATANESFSSRQNTGGRSQVSTSPVSGSGGSSSGGRSGGVFGDGLRRKATLAAGGVLETVPGSRPTTSGARSEDVEEEEEGEDVAPVPGGLGLGPEPKKRRRGGSAGNCMVQ